MMAELIHEYSFVYRSDDGTSYVLRAWGESRTDGTWEGWLEFVPSGGEGRELRTGQETTQANRDAVAYWASGLEPIYFEGAFARAS
ncbi:MAG TPA: hypothetical protein VNW71_07155 [Thermoanaerobaculia bacterium]|nr:hypothetical protein [Thermoanaerobaculia bacterium]